MVRSRTVWLWLGLLAAWGLAGIGDVPAPSRASEQGTAPAAPDGASRGAVPEGVVSRDARRDALARAQVWRRPARTDTLVPIEEAYVECRFAPTAVTGTTPKFDCVLPTGEEVRIKYGGVAEIHAEIAATALLRALGFGADLVVPVARLRCHGCPLAPFLTSRAVHLTRSAALLERARAFDGSRDFEFVALERKLPAAPIETAQLRGWGFFELDDVDPALGGAPREHVDALRLMAVFLAHWDNKVQNQRLVCLTPGWEASRRCREPFLLLQDVGATFGPRKVDFDRWAAAPVWEQRDRCAISMIDMPHRGSTFGRAVVTERGRRFLGALLDRLSAAQLTELFTAARFDRIDAAFTRRAPIADWVRVFQEKAVAVRDGAGCPAA